MGIFTKIYLLLCFLIVIFHLCSCDDSLEEEDPAFGGVSIKVFRGPSKIKGREVFAPFGYYVKMPVDSSQYLKKESSEEDASMEEFDADDASSSDDEEF